MKDIVEKLWQAAPEGRLHIDSRSVQPGDVFVALPGLHSDGRDFIGAAVRAGARAVLTEPGRPLADCPVPVVLCESLASHLGELADAYYHSPSAQMLGIGITGTNGKTTSARWTSTLLSRMGRPCASIGTLGCAMLGKDIPSVPLTTPDAVTLQTLLRDIRARGGEAFAMEASSIGLVAGRVAGTRLKVGLWTNLTRDHLDYHKTMQAYEEAKLLLADWPGIETLVVNVDDPAGVRFASRALAAGRRVIAASCEGRTLAGAESLQAASIAYSRTGVAFDVLWQGASLRLQARVLGLFNVRNMLGVIGVALACGYGLERVCCEACALVPPAGRMQTVGGEGEPLVVVDYSHTPDALDKALEALAPIVQARGGRVWTLIGAGGDRDPGKRPMLGASAAAASDAVIVTSDNPRSEDPMAIARAVQAGAPGSTLIVDRREAIETALARAHSDDVVLIAGKGHETYQEVKGVRHHFSDIEEAVRALAARKAGKE